MAGMFFQSINRIYSQREISQLMTGNRIFAPLLWASHKGLSSLQTILCAECSRNTGTVDVCRFGREPTTGTPEQRCRFMLSLWRREALLGTDILQDDFTIVITQGGSGNNLVAFLK